MVREGGAEMNVVAIEAMIGLMDAMDISLYCKSFKAMQSLRTPEAPIYGCPEK